MKVYVLHTAGAGYSRESPDVSRVLAAVTDPDLAQKIARSEGCNIAELDLDHVAPGILSRLLALGISV